MDPPVTGVGGRIDKDFEILIPDPDSPDLIHDPPVPSPAPVLTIGKVLDLIPKLKQGKIMRGTLKLPLIISFSNHSQHK